MPLSAERTVGRPVGRNGTILAVVALLAVHYLLAVSAAWQKSITFDEHVHLAQGCLHWTQPRYPFPAMNGVVAQRLAALPLVLTGLQIPDFTLPDSRDQSQFHHARTLYYESGNDFTHMLRIGRATVALLSVACGLMAFWCARALFGVPGGLLTLGLFALSPLSLAHGPLVTADTAVSLGFLAATFTFWKVTHRLTWWTLAASCAALILVSLSKISGVLIAPIFAVIALLRVFRGPALTVDLPHLMRRTFSSRAGRASALGALIAVHFVAVMPALWVFYDFQTLRLDVAHTTSRMLDAQDSTVGTPTRWRVGVMELALRTGLFPDAYAEGLRQTVVAMESTPAFMAGRYSTEGFAWYFPFAFLVKTPPALLLLIGAGVCTLAFHTDGRRDRLYQTLPLLVLIVVYAAFALTSKMNIGIRHILPLHAPLVILAGASGLCFTAGVPWRRWTTAILAACAAVSGLVSYPHYLAYINLPAGGSAHGFRLLVDSSLDWGQDLTTLRHWLDRHRRPSETVYLSYFGTGLPEFHGIDARRLPHHFDWGRREMPALTSGLYCVSATMLNSVYSPYFGPWCRAYEEDYQQLKDRVAPLLALAGQPAALRAFVEPEGSEVWEKRLAKFRYLRFGRLCAALRKRTPDASAGYSILIYRLTDQEVVDALEGPPAELHPEPASPRLPETE